MEIFAFDLKEQQVEFQVPSDPLTDTAWTALLGRIYVRRGPRNSPSPPPTFLDRDSQDPAGSSPICIIWPDTSARGKTLSARDNDSAQGRTASGIPAT
jgi:hypothetical protein